MAKHPDCRSDPGAFEEKPTFAKGDKVMVLQAVYSAAPGQAPHLPGEKGVVLADDAKVLPFQVQFADGHVMWFSQEAMERYFAKAVGLETPPA